MSPEHFAVFLECVEALLIMVIVVPVVFIALTAVADKFLDWIGDIAGKKGS